MYKNKGRRLNEKSGFIHKWSIFSVLHGWQNYRGNEGKKYNHEERPFTLEIWRIKLRREGIFVAGFEICVSELIPCEIQVLHKNGYDTSDVIPL